MALTMVQSAHLATVLNLILTELLNVDLKPETAVHVVMCSVTKGTQQSVAATRTAAYGVNHSTPVNLNSNCISIRNL